MGDMKLTSRRTEARKEGWSRITPAWFDHWSAMEGGAVQLPGIGNMGIIVASTSQAGGHTVTLSSPTCLKCAGDALDGAIFLQNNHEKSATGNWSLCRCPRFEVLRSKDLL